MLYGESKWNFEDGSKNGITWAARLHFVRIGDGVKIDFYQIYSVCHIPTYLSIITFDH